VAGGCRVVGEEVGWHEMMSYCVGEPKERESRFFFGHLYFFIAFMLWGVDLFLLFDPRAPGFICIYVTVKLLRHVDLV
jgi:hypothetical protein